MTINETLAVLERDASLHLTQRCSERDLEVLEEALGRRLPGGFRAFLARIGGGIIYDRHEVFGCRRLMLHDIELVPDLLSVRRNLEKDGQSWPNHLVPIHRCGGALHLLDLARGDGTAPVIGEAGQSWPDLSDFLEAIVLPSAVAVAVPMPQRRG
jgi:SMI1/KNR4 family protein SUKH-1